MDHYKEMYYSLFNKITDIINELQNIQQESEEVFLSHEVKEKEHTILYPHREIWRKP
ncbi:hypothetical protein [Caproiciproducens sp. CPB-2]|uniref:hypothetical protein n=1 Tax=Caproiciproducens sp. CPB-2 TaxID=3030017 RepID=UPI0023DB84AC|nr:hypothetical protein [Caproiciproducens sp. CPB-2]MDF1495555.1 hypothetical protein [Caproiciproducens sp. CPB-2]